MFPKFLKYTNSQTSSKTQTSEKSQNSSKFPQKPNRYQFQNFLKTSFITSFSTPDSFHTNFKQKNTKKTLKSKELEGFAN
jgi:hypothetical protein